MLTRPTPTHPRHCPACTDGFDAQDRPCGTCLGTAWHLEALVQDGRLLDGLQRLFQTHTVAVRSCRSGVKVDVLTGDAAWSDETTRPNGTAAPDLRDYFGGEDVREAIKNAIIGEHEWNTTSTAPS